MRGISNQDHSAPMPFVELHIFNRPEVELVIGLQRCEIRRDRRAEFGKATPEAVEASRGDIFEAFPINDSKTLSMAFAHRGHPEKGPLTHENHHVGHACRACRDDASPNHLSGISGRRGSNGELAHR